MVDPKWNLKAEYLYADLGRTSSAITYTHFGAVSTLTSGVHNSFNIARAGVNYRL